MDESTRKTVEAVESALTALFSEFAPYILEPASMALAFEHSERVRSKLGFLFRFDPGLSHIKAEVQAHLDARAAARAMDSIQA